MNKPFHIKLLLLLITAAYIYACTKDKTPGPTAVPCDPNKVYFQRDILPLVNSNCAKSGCHDAITQQDGYNFTTYEGVVAAVRPGRPGDSEMVEKIEEEDDEDRMPPPPNPPLSQEQKNLIRLWITQGAQNLACEDDTAGCKTSGVTYSNDITSILNSNCIPCHSGATINGGVNLSNYSGVKVVASNGKLYNAVAHTGQATPMPPNLKLPQCDIKAIKAWVDAGAQQN